MTFGGTTNDVWETYGYLTDGKWNELAQKMLNYDYEYLITQNSDEDKHQAIAKAGFELIEQVNDYGVYRVRGKKTEVRVYNDLHQLISVTTIDINGNPVNNNEGYATKQYEYDSNGYKSTGLYINANGEVVVNNSGLAGYRWKNNNQGKIIQETYLGADSYPIVLNYSTKECEYDRRGLLIKESFYDEPLCPVAGSECPGKKVSEEKDIKYA